MLFNVVSTRMDHFTLSQPGGVKTNRKAQEQPIFAPLLMSDLLNDGLIKNYVTYLV